MIQERSARWLPSATDPKIRAVIERALADIGICEMPLGSNRSGVIDRYNLRAGAIVGSYWCASALACWSWDSDLWAPKPSRAPSCDLWLRDAVTTGRVVTDPQPGHVVLYHSATNDSDMVHCGLVVRVSPVILSVEGNTSVGGAGVEPNGTAVALKRTNLARVKCYVRLT